MKGLGRSLVYVFGEEWGCVCRGEGGFLYNVSDTQCWGAKTELDSSSNGKLGPETVPRALRHHERLCSWY